MNFPPPSEQPSEFPDVFSVFQNFSEMNLLIKKRNIRVLNRVVWWQILYIISLDTVQTLSI